MNNINNLYKFIGNTPLVAITYSYQNQIKKAFAKLEWYNLTGSIKDRPALNIIKNATLKKELKPNQPICEVTSGNMGISLCAISNFTHHKVIVCMPKDMSIERQQLLKNYGAKLELVDDFFKAKELSLFYQKNGAFLSNQFDNFDNIRAHKKTAFEICKKLGFAPCFVCGVGTGGTIMGIGKYLKKQKNIKIFEVVPKENKHKIQGLSDGITPKIYNNKFVDKKIVVSSNDAISMAQKLCKELGLAVGISSGANFLGCVLSDVNNIATIFADDNKKYLSTDLSKDISSELVNSIKLIKYEIL